MKACGWYKYVQLQEDASAAAVLRYLGEDKYVEDTERYNPVANTGRYLELSQVDELEILEKFGDKYSVTMLK